MNSSRSLLQTALLALLLANPAPAQTRDAGELASVLADFRAACEKDAGRVWGHSLCGPVALVDPATRMVFASDSIPGVRVQGGWVGVLPASIPVSNTSVEWGGRAWATVMLPLPRDRFDRLALIAHESFHREQSSIGVLGGDPASTHLDEPSARRWLRLELRALSAAVETGDVAAARDALLFRAARWAAAPGADTLETALERGEGLAEYTGVRIALDATGESLARAASRIRAVEERGSYVRSFAYGTGVGLGLVLDRVAPGWQARSRAGADPAALLSAALSFRAPSHPRTAAVARATRYGGTQVTRDEAARDSARRVRRADFQARLVTGAVLELRQRALSRQFDPNTLVPLPGEGMVYPTGSFQAEWGRLEVTIGGALVASDFGIVRVPVAPTWRPTEHSPLVGEGWTLMLAPGWRVVPGTRSGGWVVAAP